jgi:hypothetical protein
MTDAGSTLSPTVPARPNVSCTTAAMTCTPDAKSLRGRPRSPGKPLCLLGCAGPPAACCPAPAAAVVPAAGTACALRRSCEASCAGCRGGGGAWWLSACANTHRHTTGSSQGQSGMCSAVHTGCNQQLNKVA